MGREDEDVDTEVGEQWKMTDISRSSTYSVQGAFGEPMTPTVQGFLGPVIENVSVDVCMVF